jgi:hypothetical protein
MTTRRHRRTSQVGFVVGVLLAGAVLIAGRVPDEGRALDAQLKLSATATGGVAALSQDRLLTSGRLAPGGDPLEGQLRLLNQTSKSVDLLVRATAADPALDRIAAVELQAGDADPMRTTLGALRRWRPVGARVASKREQTVTVRVWIPGSASAGYEGRRADVTLEFTRKGASL